MSERFQFGKKMANVYGSVKYRNVIGSSLKDRIAFDGSVPYSISCAAELNLDNSSGASVNAEGVFCLIGALGDSSVNSGVFPSAVKTGLAKQCAIRLRDLWVEGICTSWTGQRCRVDVAVYDPTGSFPGATSEHTHLYYGVFEDGMLKIPDIEGLVVSAGLNVGLKFSCSVSNNVSLHLIVHCVADIDD